MRFSKPLSRRGRHESTLQAITALLLMMSSQWAIAAHSESRDSQRVGHRDFASLSGPSVLRTTSTSGISVQVYTAVRQDSAACTFSGIRDAVEARGSIRGDALTLAAERIPPERDAAPRGRYVSSS